MPSPQGSLDLTWWYLVTARCELGATSFRSYSAEEILNAVEYAFSFVLTDALDEVEREGVEVAVTAVSDTSASVHSTVASFPMMHNAASQGVEATEGTSTARPAKLLARVSPLDSEQRAYEVSAWCPDHPTAIKVRTCFISASIVA
jgi:hypothetical protein